MEKECERGKEAVEKMEKECKQGKVAVEKVKMQKRDLEEKQVEIESLQEEFVTTIQIKGKSLEIFQL